MEFQFGTPSRLERQIAQDLMRNDSELDLSMPGSMPGTDTKTHSFSASPPPFTNITNNQNSYSKRSISSSIDDYSIDKANSTSKAKPAISLASAIAKSNRRKSDRRSNSSRSSSSSFKAAEKHGYDPTSSQLQRSLRSQHLGSSVNSSASVDPGSDGSFKKPFPVPYSHIRSRSPPLTSTPHRTVPASTFGSRTRTSVILRPAHHGQHRSIGSVDRTTLGSASRGARSTRSASTLLDDLTESSIAPEEYDQEERQGTTVDSAASRDFVVYGSQTGKKSLQPKAVGDAPPESDTQTQTQTHSMHTCDIRLTFSHDHIQVPGQSSPTSLFPPEQPDQQQQQQQNKALREPTTDSPATDWAQRRAERRQLGNPLDVSVIDEVSECDETENDQSLRSSLVSGSSLDRPTQAADRSQREPSFANSNPSNDPPATVRTKKYDDSRPTIVETEGENSGTTLSSPAAARLARQGSAVGLRKQLHSDVNTSTPHQQQVSGIGTATENQNSSSLLNRLDSITDSPASTSAMNAATPKANASFADQEKMKAYLLNSVKATAHLRLDKGRKSDTRIQALERLRAQVNLSRTPGALSEGNHTSDDTAQISSDTGSGTPRLRMDRLGKANTFAAGQTPLPRGKIAELLRQGALSQLGDSSHASSPNPPTLTSLLAEERTAGGIGHRLTADDQQSVVESLAGFSDASSISDLTAHPRKSAHGPLGLRANTSFPGLGAAEVGTEANVAARPRVDPARLALYQSKLNARLDAENEELKRERDDLARQLEALQVENQKLSQSRDTLQQQGASASEKDELFAERERANDLDQEAHELVDLLDQREAQVEALENQVKELQNAGQQRGDGATTESRQGEADETVKDLQFQISQLETLVQQRDKDIFNLEQQHVIEIREAIERETCELKEQAKLREKASLEALHRAEAGRDQAIERLEQLKVDLEESRKECDRIQAEMQAKQARELGETSLEKQNADLRQQLSASHRRINHLESEVQKANEQVASAAKRLDIEQGKTKSLERKNKESKRQMEHLESDLHEATRKAELTAHELFEMQQQQDPDSTPRNSDLRSISRTQNNSARIKRLEAELAGAHDEVKRLHQELDRIDFGASRDSLPNVKDLEIETLRKQKAELKVRVNEYRQMISNGVGSNLVNLSLQDAVIDSDRTVLGGNLSVPFVTPNKAADGSRASVSPLPKSVLSLRHLSAIDTPRSPAELSEVSWLYNESSLGAAGVKERIAFLEAALDGANVSIDAKLQRLDEAGVAHLTLAERLEKANKRIAELEAELERMRMRSSVLLGAQSEQAFGNNSTVSSLNRSTKSSVQRQKVFADVHAQLEALKSRWAKDQDKLQQREREVERREREVGDKSREKRQYREVLAELNRFREATTSLQEDLHWEQANQREILARSKASSQEQAAIETKLLSTRTELEQVKTRLEEKLVGLEDLSRKYFEKTTVLPDGLSQTLTNSREREALEQQMTSVAGQVKEVQAQVEALKNERLELLSQRADLHHKFAQANEKYESVSADLALSRQTLSAHQAQLDEQIEQIETIHAELRAKKAAFEQVAGDRDRLRAERDEIVRDVGTFENELRKLRREADRQGQDLEMLRVQREEARRHQVEEEQEKERERIEMMKQVRFLMDQLKAKTKEVDGIKQKVEEMEKARLASPPPYSPSQQEALVEQSLAALRAQHKLECKGLLTQIKYMNMKLTKAAHQRWDLSFQKEYISRLLKGYTQIDDHVGKMIFDLNLESDQRVKQREQLRLAAPKRRWKKAIIAVRSIIRMKAKAKEWEVATRLKAAIQLGYDDLERRRAIKAAKLKQEQGQELQRQKRDTAHCDEPPSSRQRRGDDLSNPIIL